MLLTPGQAPLDELAVRVASVAGVDAGGVRRELDDGPAGLVLTAWQAVLASYHPPGDRPAGDVPGTGRLLLVVDQFEQMFTRCPDERERRAFVAALHAVATATGPQGGHAALVVLAVRADFEARCAEFEELAQAVRDRYLVTPMTARQLRLVITGPARAVGADVDSALVEELAGQARSRHGAATGSGVLPLVSHALDQAWRHRAGTGLALADYERTGGIEGAVAASAQRAYAQLTAPQQDVARMLFLCMTATSSDGIDTTARLTLSELTGGIPGDRQRDVQAAVDAFVAERLLTVGADSVEISHEVLLAAWPLLRDTWLAETHADRIIRTRLTAATTEWASHGRDSSYLYGGSLLQAAVSMAGRVTADPARYPALTAAEHDFLRAGHRIQHRAARLRRATFAVLTALTLILALTTALVIRASAQTAYQRDVAISEELISNSENIGDTNPVLARLLAVAAWRLSPSSQTARQAWLAMLDAATLPGLRVIDSHAGLVYTVAFSPNGKILASSGSDGKIRFWNASTGLPIRAPLNSGIGLAYSVAFSPNGKILAAGGSSGKIRLWNTANGQPIRTPLNVGNTSVNSVAFSPNGKTLASASSDGKIRLWNTANGQQIRTPLNVGNTSVNSVAFSPNGKILAAGGSSGKIQLWNTATEQPTRALLTGSAGSTGQVTSMAFSPNGKILASCHGNDGEIQFWDPATGQPTGNPPDDSTGLAFSVAFSPDGKTVAVGRLDGTAQLWDSATGQPVGTPLTGSAGLINSVAFSPDGKTLATGSYDGTVRLWIAATGQSIGTPLDTGTDVIGSVAFSPDGRTLADGSYDGAVRFWDTATSQPIGPSLDTGTSKIYSVAFSPNGKSLATGDDDVQLWNTATGHSIVAPLISTGPVYSVAFSPNGKILAGGSSNGTIWLWDTATGQPIGMPLDTGAFLVNGTGRIGSVAFSPNGKTLASGSSEGAVRLWDVATGQLLGTPLTGSATGGVFSVAFSPNGKTLAIGSFSGTVRLWGTAPGRPIGTPLTSTGPVYSVAFSPNGKTLVSGSIDGTVRLWDTATGQLIGTPLNPGTGPVFSVAFSPNGKTLAIGGIEGTIRLWNVAYLQNLVPYLCTLAGRPMTRTEWERYVPAGPSYFAVCS